MNRFLSLAALGLTGLAAAPAFAVTDPTVVETALTLQVATWGAVAITVLVASVGIAIAMGLISGAKKR